MMNFTTVGDVLKDIRVLLQKSVKKSCVNARSISPNVQNIINTPLASHLSIDKVTQMIFSISINKR